MDERRSTAPASPPPPDAPAPDGGDVAGHDEKSPNWWRWLRLKAMQLVRWLGKATGTPHQIALGVAVGFFVGWLPIVGIQMAVAVAACTLLRCNRVVPLLPIWLTNPATIVPVYGFNYWVGWKLVGGPPLAEITGTLKKMIPRTPPPDMGWFRAWWTGFVEAMRELATLGWEAQLPLWLGCVLVGAVLALAGYYATHWAVSAFRAALHNKRERRGARLRERLAQWRRKRHSARIHRKESHRGPRDRIFSPEAAAPPLSEERDVPSEWVPPPLPDDGPDAAGRETSAPDS